MTETLQAAARLNVALFSTPGLGFKPNMRFEKRMFEAAERNVLLVEDMPVFRSGHFYDSMGFEHTWDGFHMEQMVANYNLLKTRGIIPDLPVRKDHPGFLDSRLETVIGYHSDLKTEVRKSPVDGVEYTYLLATFEIIDPAAIEKVSSGLWRNVSAETGSWLSNDSMEFWPVYQGVAYVDFSAVEGLKGFNSHNGVGKTFSIMSDNKEAPVTGDATPGNNAQAAAGGGSALPANTTSFQTQDPAAFARSQFTFTVGGRQTQDFSFVQQHITTLETAASEAREQNRRNFIKGLSEGGTPKILASQIPNIEAYALKMDDESWKSFAESWGAATAVTSVSMHGVGPSNPAGNTPAGSVDAGSSEVQVFAGVLKQHRLAGMKQEEIAKTQSFSKLKTLDPNHPALTA